jgi:hypothetical protein
VRIRRRAGQSAGGITTPAPTALDREIFGIIGRDPGALAAYIKPQAQDRIQLGAQVPEHERRMAGSAGLHQRKRSNEGGIRSVKIEQVLVTEKERKELLMPSTKRQEQGYER